MATDNVAQPKETLKILVLVDNVSTRKDLRSEHGFSALLETDRGRLLFDVGSSGDAVLANAAVLGVDLTEVDAIALSHGHYDHTGGLAKVLEEAPRATLYVHPETAAKRWGSRLGFRKSIGVSQRVLRAAERRKPVLVTAPTALPMGVTLSGTIPGPASPGEKGFTAEIAGVRGVDRFVDEMFVLAETPAGVVLVTGCCHRGLVNTLNHARTMTAGRDVVTVVGGLHMGKLTHTELDAAIAALQSAGTAQLIAGHCTGKDAVAYLAEHASFNVESFHVGFTRTW
ncbi:MAG TPA: MBL fold metallo-hydrolase [Planctomycetota bacterium]|nr:MBL fold metallo-hydrolase [Planctomycetota bacterium]